MTPLTLALVMTPLSSVQTLQLVTRWQLEMVQIPSQSLMLL
jgi:hypothetical protein